MHVKKVFALILALAMVLSLNVTSAFAAEVPETLDAESEGRQLVVHEVDLDIQPGEAAYSVPRRMWAQNYYDINTGMDYTTSSFSVPERYFAFETWATDVNGHYRVGSYNVTYYGNGSSLGSTSNSVDNTVDKVDWIDHRSTNNTGYFYIYNHCNAAIRVHLKYYSWS